MTDRLYTTNRPPSLTRQGRDTPADHRVRRLELADHDQHDQHERDRLNLERAARIADYLEQLCDIN